VSEYDAKQFDREKEILKAQPVQQAAVKAGKSGVKAALDAIGLALALFGLIVIFFSLDLF
jgi:hypothetical protein